MFHARVHDSSARPKRLRATASLAAAALALALPARADKPAAAPAAFERVEIRSEGVFVDVPRGWIVQPAPEPSRMLVKEYPMQLRNANASVQVLPANSTFDAMLEYHEKNNVPANFPNGTVLSKDIVRFGDARAMVLRIGGLTGKLQDFEALDGVVELPDRFVIATLLYDRTQRDRYDAIHRRLLASAKATPGPGAALESDGRPVAGRVAWVGSLDKALDQARRRRTAVMVAIVGGDGDALDRVHGDGRVVELSRSLVCVVADPRVHSPQSAAGAPSCPTHRGVTCAEHVAAGASLAREIRGTALPSTAQHVFVDPDGTVIARLERTPTAAALAESMRSALRAVRQRLDVPDADPIAGPAAEWAEAKDAASRLSIVREVLESGRMLAAQKLVARVVDGGDPAAIAELFDSIGLVHDPGAAPLVVDRLEHPRVEVRKAAAAALERLACPTAVDALSARVKIEGRDEVRSALVRALAACGAKSPAAAKTLLPLARTGSLAVRVDTVIALRSFPDDAEVAAAVLQCLETSDKRALQAACAWTLGFFRDERAEPALSRLIAAGRADEFSPVFRAALDRIPGDGSNLAAYDALRVVFERSTSMPGREGFVGTHH
jgi:HEAT repeat protein